jgi:flagellar basal body rod protein FlgB
MGQVIERLKKFVIRSLELLIVTDTFMKWIKEAKATDGDIVVINNSFIYRKPLIKTSKNGQYLCVKLEDGEPNLNRVFICKPGELNSDFKLFSRRSYNLPLLEPLDDVLQAEVERIGWLIFVLIGKLQDTPAEAPLDHSVVRVLRVDPFAKGTTMLMDDAEWKIIVVNQLTDPGSAWDDVKPQCERHTNKIDSLQANFASAFDKLQNEARLRLVLPSRTASKTNNSFIARVRKSVSKQRELYEAALQRWTKNNVTMDSHQREVMRIAYNFADDAIKILKLLVSIADLKAVLLWCTINEHFGLAEAFRNLPWTKSYKKPSLNSYREIIGGARNHVFHNLLTFDRTIEANLEGVDVKARRLTLIPAHGRRKMTVPFDYEDREMVEILSELTRAPEIAVTLDFWKKNTAVMKSFEKLLESTEDALWVLNEAQGHMSWDKRIHH